MDLLKDESIVYQTRVMRFSCWMLVVIGIVTSFALVGIPIFIFGLHEMFKKYILTNKRFIIQGWFGSKEMRIDKIETVNRKGLSWTVEIGGSGGTKLKASNVENGQKLLNQIHEAIESVKK